jgi:hypothetical protein
MIFTITIFIILIFLLILYIYNKFYSNNKMIYIKSDVDNKYYYVRQSKTQQEAVNTLGIIRENMLKLFNQLKNNKNNYPNEIEYINNLSKINDVLIMESSSDEKTTSYTINKGDKMVFCIRSKLFDNIHDMNTIMYVVIHEMAHVACPEFGHGELFKKIFKFLLKEASNIKIYNIVDYRKEPINYCGMVINEYIL